jgi:hypothetical protein
MRKALRTIVVVLPALFCEGGVMLRAVEVGKELCPYRIASLTPIPGNLDTQFAAERVEIRQCPLDPSKLSGWVQLAAWEKGAYKPSLVLNLEDSGFRQFAMISGVYAFETIGGKASQVLVITFEFGKPKIALESSVLSHPRIRTDAETLTVSCRDGTGHEHEYRFVKSSTPMLRR